MSKYSHLSKQFLQNVQRKTKIRADKPKINKIRSKFKTFYTKKYTCPHIPDVAQGPWIQTQKEHTVYDAGGYGMLGLGHNPIQVMEELSKPQVMTNNMAPNIAQAQFSELLSKEIGNTTLNYCPYTKWICMNSSLEANSLALRIANKHNYKNPVRICIKKSFYCQMNKPCQLFSPYTEAYHVTSSIGTTQKIYEVSINNIEDLKQTIWNIHNNNEFLELIIVEPVMHERHPGISLTPEYYRQIREITNKLGSMLLVDSVQAGFRCYGHLSIVDFPGFQCFDAPDMEILSKAMTAGQYPMSTLVLNKKAEKRFLSNLYRNDNSSDPRGLVVAASVLSQIDISVKLNIVNSGAALKKRLQKLQKKHPNFIKHVTGTGLLVSMHLNPQYKSTRVIQDLCVHGLNISYGVGNAVLFTPWFYLNEFEMDYMNNIIDDYFSKL